MVYRSVKRTVDLLCERLAAMLETRVVVVDQRDVIIASSEPGRVGFALDWGVARHGAPVTRLPLHLDGQHWEVVVAAPPGDSTMADSLLRHMVRFMMAEADSPAALPPLPEVRNLLIYDLLRGAPLAEAEVARLAQILGMPLTWPRAVILIHTGQYLQPPASGDPGGRERLLARSESLINSLGSAFPAIYDPISANIGGGQIAVLVAPGEEEAASTPGAAPAWAALDALKRLIPVLITRLQHESLTRVTIGLGRYHPGLKGLARSYRDAVTALTTGERLFGPNRLYCLDTLGTAAYAALADEETKVDLARQRLHRLLGDPDLIETLNMFFAENCSPSAAAGRLAVHRNTLAYRLDKIASLTGLDPRRFDDAVQLRLALLLHTLGTHDAGEYSPPPSTFEQFNDSINRQNYAFA